MMTGVPPNRRQQRVLIVDDLQHNRRLLEAMLSAEGYRLTGAGGGVEALAMIAKDPPDLILLDAMMPGMSGYQVSTELKSNGATKHIPIIVVTTLDDREARITALNTGAEDYLSKPIDRVELCVRVRNLLRLKAYADFVAEYNARLEGEVLSSTATLVERTRTLEQHAAALRLNEARTTYALGAARMGVWEVNYADGRLAWSETMGPLFGLAPGGAPADVRAFLSLVHSDDRHMIEAATMRSLTDGVDFEQEYRVVWADGSLRWLAARATVIRDDDGNTTGMRGVTTDVSDRQALETQLRQAQKMEAVGQLAGGVAHDFNNLLTAILGYSAFVIESLTPDDERRADMDEIVVAAHRAVGLTRQLLAFSRKQVVQPTVVDLNGLVAGMLQMLGRLIGESVRLVPELDPQLGAVRADVGQLEQVLMNLVVNARDAMPAGGRLAVTTANVTLDRAFIAALECNAGARPGAYVMLAVSDSGCGMTEEVRSKLFEPFFTTKEAGKGTGLGLATVYGIVRQSGGFIVVESVPDNGASFTVYLPEVARDPIAAIAHRIVPDAAVGTETVLLVEDDDAVRALTSTILERAGYRVIVAASPAEAEPLFDHQPDAVKLLVTDVVMPGCSGPKLYERLARRRPRLKVLYVSGYTNDAILQQGVGAPSVDFLQKPFTADALSRQVRVVLDRPDEIGAVEAVA